MAFSKMIVVSLVEKMIVVLFSVFWMVRAQDGSNVQCVNELVDWCDKMTFSNGYSNFLSTEVLSSGQYMIHCMSGSGGANCTRNNSPWFSCSTDKKLKYKGNKLQKDSTDGADDEICQAARKANNMQGGKFDQEAFDKGMERLNQSMVNLQNNMKKVFRECFPFCETGNPFGKGFPFNRGK